MSETRKLVAILVPTSSDTGADEGRPRLQGLRSDLIDPAIAAHHVDEGDAELFVLTQIVRRRGAGHDHHPSKISMAG